MRYDIYGKQGHIGTVCSRKSAFSCTPSYGPFVILIRATKFGAVQSGLSGIDGIPYRSTMLLYPAGSRCRQITPDAFLTEAGVSK